MSNTLMQIQEAAIEALQALPEQGKRAAGYGMTLLNKPPRSVAAIRKAYYAQSCKLGFRFEQVEAQWQDIKDMAKLEASAL